MGEGTRRKGVRSPIQGSDGVGLDDPGRCPGLVLGRTVGAWGVGRTFRSPNGAG